jgi:hypothetical protein
MTDDQIGEIYSLARESFFGGQRAFQVQAYPFRMTAANFAKHRNNPNIPFWRMLKEGNDHFEVTHQEPNVEVCEKRYVFNPQAPQNATPVNNGIMVGTPWGGFQSQQAQAALKFNPAGKCPAYEVPAEVAAAVKDKQRQDDSQIASLSLRTIPAPIKTGRDGGMHPMFLAKLKPQEIREADGTVRYMVDTNAAKQLGTYVNPPFETFPTEETPAPAAKQPATRGTPQQKGGSNYMMAAAESKPAPAPPRAAESGGMFSGLFASTRSSVGRLFGGDEDTKPVSPPAAKAAAPTPTPKPAARPAPPTPAAAVPAKPQPAAQPEPEQSAQATPAPTPARQSAASGSSLMTGAAPTVPAGSFDQRWGAVR